LAPAENVSNVADLAVVALLLATTYSRLADLSMRLKA
jgi:hypothetical protein